MLSEVKLVTEQTETIKAQISSDLWIRQMMWSNKRDAYANALKSSHTLKESVSGLLAVLKLKEDDISDQNRIGHAEREAEARIRFSNTLTGFYNALTEAELFVSKDSAILLDNGKKVPTNPQTSTQCFALMLLLQNWNNSLIDSARSELGSPKNKGL